MNPIKTFAWCLLNNLLPEGEVFRSIGGDTPADFYIVHAEMRIHEVVRYYKQPVINLEDLGYAEVEE